jgi:hypothetical protein
MITVKRHFSTAEPLFEDVSFANANVPIRRPEKCMEQSTLSRLLAKQTVNRENILETKRELYWGIY